MNHNQIEPQDDNGYDNYRRHPESERAAEDERSLPTGLNVRKKNTLKMVLFGLAGLAVSAVIVISLMSWAGNGSEEQKPKNDLLSAFGKGKKFKGEQDELLDEEAAAASETAAASDAPVPGEQPASAPMPSMAAAASDPYADIRARKYAGNVLVDETEGAAADGTAQPAGAGAMMPVSAAPVSPDMATLPAGTGIGEGNIPGDTPIGGAAGSNSSGSNALTGRLNSGVYLPTRAGSLGNRDYLLARGTGIPCVTLTKIVTDFPGLTRCQVTKDVYSANGKTLLIARGSTITGEQTAALTQGQSRVFALWSDLRTPDGLVVRLDSPGADPLGASGHPARVNHHFWRRIGGAVMISLIHDVITVYGNRSNRNVSNNQDTTVTYENTSEAVRELSTEILRNSINIPPTGYVNQGTEIMVFAARDVDFSGVYENVTLHPRILQ